MRDYLGRGLAVETRAGIGADLQVNEVAGAFASRTMGLDGIATAIPVPLMLRLPS